MSDSTSLLELSQSALAAAWGCSPAIVDDLQKFALEIWRSDIISVDVPEELVSQARVDAQQSKLSLPVGLLKAPLPIVTACGTTTAPVQRMPQLLVTRGDDGRRLWNALCPINTGGPQTSKVVFGAATSGVGKTHAAYDIGQNFACTIIIRVVNSDQAKFAPPFDWLIDQIRPFVRTLDKHPSYHSEISQSVASYIHLVLLAYVFVTVTALCAIHESNLPRRDDVRLLREFVLRLHRNEKGDSLVRRVLKESITNGIIATSSLTSQLHGPDMGKIEKIETACSATLQHFRLPLVLAVDEAHELMNYKAAQDCGRLVLREGLAPLVPINRAGASASLVGDSPSLAIGPDEMMITGTGAAGDISPALHADAAEVESSFAALEVSASAPDALVSMPIVTTTSDVPGLGPVLPGAERNLFYSLVIVLTTLNIRQHWRSYLTGTTFTMKQVMDAVSVSLKLRTEPKGCAPVHRFRVADMEFIFNHYFNLPEDFIDDPIRDLLRQFEGRPVLFVEGVWDPFLFHVISTRGLPSAETWKASLAAEKSSLVDKWRRHARAVLQKNKTIHADGTGSMALIPRLVEALLMRNGRFTVDEDDVLDVAICDGLLAVSSEARYVDMTIEPIICEGIRLAMAEQISLGRVLDMRIRSSRSDAASKGDILEVAVAWHLALKCTLPSLRTPPESVRLSTLLASIPGCPSTLPNSVYGWWARATRVVNLAYPTPEPASDKPVAGAPHDPLTDNRHPFSRFVGSNGEVDDTIILIGVSKTMGVDIAFVVSRRADRGARTEHAVVVIQCKNTSASAVSDVMMTLHPGCQHVTNITRRMLLGLAHSEPLQCASTDGYESWASLCNDSTKSFLFSDWIRVPLLSRKVSPDLQSFSNTVVRGDVTDYSSCLGWSRQQLTAAVRSPMVWISLGNAFMYGWVDSPEFPATVLSALLELTRTTSVVKLQHHHMWIPVSTEDARQLLEGTAASSSLRQATRPRTRLPLRDGRGIVIRTASRISRNRMRRIVEARPTGGETLLSRPVTGSG